MFVRSLAVLAMLAQYTVAQITGTYSSILLTATGTPTFTVPVEQETNFPNCTVKPGSFELGVEVCDSIYKADPALEKSVSKEIASATKSARDAIATRNPTQLADYPPCAGDDLATLITIVESLCVPVGGTSPGIPSACRASSGNGTGCGTGTGSPKPSVTAHVSRRSNRLGSFKDSVVKK
ncbi:MAG: hypothetical protein Q9167_001581 [Letrouitia subvulpina]